MKVLTTTGTSIKRYRRSEGGDMSSLTWYPTMGGTSKKQRHFIKSSTSFFILLTVSLVGTTSRFVAAGANKGSDGKDDTKNHVLSMEPLYKGAKTKAVINLSPQEFETQVMVRPKNEESAAGDIWMVQFYAKWCDVCKEMAPLYNQVAQALDGIVNVAAVDIGIDEETKKDGDNESDQDRAAVEAAKRIAKRYNIVEYPHIMVFSRSITYANNADRNEPLVYDKPQKDFQSMVQLAMDAIVQTITWRVNGGKLPPQEQQKSSSSSSGNKKPKSKKKEKGGSQVVHLNQKNIKELVYEDTKHVWMVAFIAPWCGHCKALLPDWHSASRQLDGHGVKMGVVDATVETQLAQIYGVNGYPTIKVFTGIGPTSRKKGPRTAIDYQGGRTKDQIIQGAIQYVEQSGGYVKDIMELTSSKVMEDICDEVNKLCLITALPHILESGVEGRMKYISLMQNVTKAMLGSSAAAPFEFIWFEGGNQQLPLEETLELTFGYPAVAAVSLDKKAYAIHRGSFSFDKLKQFINSILNGRQKVTPLPQSYDLVTKVTTAEPWDGKEGVPPEEDDLSDIMGDDWQSDL